MYIFYDMMNKKMIRVTMKMKWNEGKVTLSFFSSKAWLARPSKKACDFNRATVLAIVGAQEIEVAGPGVPPMC